MKIDSKRLYIITFKINDKIILTFRGKILLLDNRFIEFIDTNKDHFLYNSKSIISIQELKEDFEEWKKMMI